MKKSLAVILALGSFVAGCGDKSASSAGGTNSSSSGGSIADAPGDYLRAAAKGQQDAVKVVDTAAIDKAISLFNVEKGRNPKDLNELVTEKYLPKIPETPFGTKLDYDSAAGRVQVVKQ
ncbi:MAG TPA: hypothetical protein VLT36_15160 [Candidatus Dormibacteraeota bacterium]|nr:hypothetical protein [Candidatus Dormibacteraeota bacterium]